MSDKSIAAANASHASHDFCVIGEYRYMINLARTDAIQELRTLESPEREAYFLEHHDLKSLESDLPKPEDFKTYCAAICTDGQQIPGQAVSHAFRIIGNTRYSIALDRKEVVEQSKKLTTTEEKDEFFRKHADQVKILEK